MWDSDDKYSFMYSFEKMGYQMDKDSTEIGALLLDLARNEKLHRYLEIGTWNGLGSTLCFKQGFQQRKDWDYSLDSLESNKDKYEVAKNIHLHDPHIRIHNQVVTNHIPTWDMIVKDLKILPEEEETLYKWHHVDKSNSDQCYIFIQPFINICNSSSRMYDVVLLDGGECTTYYEFMVVKDWAKILICDDCKCVKTRMVRENLLNDPEWILLQENLEERNGYAAFIHCSMSSLL